ncbi:MAG: hypothetical protein LUE86_05725 [Clostridiales bacterium]|nr:hypothetical protein [Clostridiales bacterium]
MKIKKYALIRTAGNWPVLMDVSDSYEKVLELMRADFHNYEKLGTAESSIYKHSAHVTRTNQAKIDWRILPIAVDIPNSSSPYIAMKRWLSDDVAGCLKEWGYEGTEEEVNRVVGTGGLRALNDCTDEDWEIIHNAMSEAGFTNQNE